MIQKLLIWMSKITNRNRNTNFYKDDFDSCAQTYDTVITRKLLGKFTEKTLNELNIKYGMHCIDLGCGTGHVVELIAPLVQSNGSIIGCDISSAMLEIAEEKLSRFSNVKFINKDMLETLNEQEVNSIDLITSFWSIGYGNPERILKEVNRVLVRGGRVAVIVNLQASLSELQQRVTKILLKNPLVLKHIPPINFPSNIKAFKKIIGKANLGILSLSEEFCEQRFDTGEALVSWMKTSGPCAGFRKALKDECKESVFNKIQALVDREGGITLTFRFIRFIGTKE